MKFNKTHKRMWTKERIIFFGILCGTWLMVLPSLAQSDEEQIRSVLMDFQQLLDRKDEEELVEYFFKNVPEDEQTAMGIINFLMYRNDILALYQEGVDQYGEYAFRNVISDFHSMITSSQSADFAQIAQYADITVYGNRATVRYEDRSTGKQYSEKLIKKEGLWYLEMKNSYRKMAQLANNRSVIEEFIQDMDQLLRQKTSIDDFRRKFEPIKERFKSRVN